MRLVATVFTVMMVSVPAVAASQACDGISPLTLPRVGRSVEDSGVAVASINSTLAVWVKNHDMEFSTEVAGLLTYADGAVCSLKIDEATSHGFLVGTHKKEAKQLYVAWCNKARGFCYESFVNLSPLYEPTIR